MRQPEQIEADLTVAEGKARKPSLPKELPDQVAAIRTVLAEAEAPIRALAVARRFSQGKRVETKVEEILRTLALLGQAEQSGEGFVLSS